MSNTIPDDVIEAMRQAFVASSVDNSSCAVDDILATLAAAEAKGWKLVPIEATEAQHDAAREWSRHKYGKPIGFDASKGCWAAMISAAPTVKP